MFHLISRHSRIKSLSVTTTANRRQRGREGGREGVRSIGVGHEGVHAQYVHKGGVGQNPEGSIPGKKLGSSREGCRERGRGAAGGEEDTETEGAAGVRGGAARGAAAELGGDRAVEEAVGAGAEGGDEPVGAADARRPCVPVLEARPVGKGAE